jgi:hypothetical protein
MDFLFKNNGKLCAAKAVFTVTWACFLIKIMLSGIEYGGVSLATADYAGMAAFLSPLAAAYGWRSATKAGEK